MPDDDLGLDELRQTLERYRAGQLSPQQKSDFEKAVQQNAGLLRGGPFWDDLRSAGVPLSSDVQTLKVDDLDLGGLADVAIAEATAEGPNAVDLFSGSAIGMGPAAIQPHPTAPDPLSGPMTVSNAPAFADPLGGPTTPEFRPLETGFGEPPIDAAGSGSWTPVDPMSGPITSTGPSPRTPAFGAGYPLIYRVGAIGAGVVLLLAVGFGGYQLFNHPTTQVIQQRPTPAPLTFGAPPSGSFTYLNDSGSGTSQRQETDQVQPTGSGAFLVTRTIQEPTGTLIETDHVSGGQASLTGQSFKDSRGGSSLVKTCPGAGVPLAASTKVGTSSSFTATCTGTASGSPVTDAYSGQVKTSDAPIVNLNGKQVHALQVDSVYTIVTTSPGQPTLTQQLRIRSLYGASPFQLLSRYSLESITGNSTINLSNKQSLVGLDPKDDVTVAPTGP